MLMNTPREYQCPFPGAPPPDYLCQAKPRYNYASKIPRPSIYPPVSSLYKDKPDYLLGPERSVRHDIWVTQNNAVHDRKFYREERDYQPNHPQAPSQHLLHFVRPDYHLKIQGVSQKNMKCYNPFPYHISESKAEYKARYPEASMYGQAGVFITDHVVGLPLNRVNVRPAFTYDDMFSVLRKAHPYMTTNRIYHKNFEDELPQHRLLDNIYNAKDTDVAVKYRVRPMLDPFEQSLVKAGTLPSLDVKKENPGEKSYAHIKHFFRRPPYSGCYPRVHQPVPHLGWGTSYKDHYGRPSHPNMAYNFHKDQQFGYIQPRLSACGLMKTPAMYVSENNIYGSGRNVSKYVDCDRRLEPVVIAQNRRDESQAKASEAMRQSSGCVLEGGMNNRPNDSRVIGC